MNYIPALPGSYALQLRLSAPIAIGVGRLGIISFPGGDYLYLGSARGPGGLRARLAHHLKHALHPHWHLDYLHAWAEAREIFFIVEPTDPLRSHSTYPVECLWSQFLALQSGAFVPAAGFGASDCRNGCLAHLVGLPTDINSKVMLGLLQSCMGEEKECRARTVLHVAAARAPRSC